MKMFKNGTNCISQAYCIWHTDGTLNKIQTGIENDCRIAFEWIDLLYSLFSLYTSSFFPADVNSYGNSGFHPVCHHQTGTHIYKTV